jgi:electron transfer flavoprotein beta subunit
MQVIACIKQVPDTTQVQIDPKTNTLVRDGIPFIVNPYDTHALEECLRLKDRYGFKVTAVSMGPPNAEAALRKALSLGADRAVLVSDRVFGGADTLATSNVLTAAIRKLAEDDDVAIVFCGKQTIDGDTAQVGPGIATRMELEQLTLVDKIVELDVDSKKLIVRRKLEGRYETVQTILPAMITVVREINRPRYPTVPMRLRSKQAQVEMWNNEVLQLDVNKIGLKGSPTWVSKIFSPQRDKGEMIGAGISDPKEVASLLLDKMISKDIITV